MTGEESASSQDLGGGSDSGTAFTTSNSTQDSESSSYSSYSDADYSVGIDWTVMGPATSTYALIFLLGLAGNTMVIFAVFCSRRLHTATSLLLANLAVADLLLILLLLPIKLVAEVVNDWPLGEALCRIAPFIHAVSPTCSVYTMSVIALERCYAVVVPLKAKSVITMGRTRIAILALWLFSVATCTPSFFSKKIHKMEHGGMKWEICNDAWPGNASLGYTIYLCLLLFVIPVLIMATCYIIVVVWLYKGKRLTRNMRPLSAADIPLCRMQGDGEGAPTSVTREETVNCLGDEGQDDGSMEGKHRRGAYSAVAIGRPQRKQRTESQKLQRIVIMLIVVVVVFLICWCPFLVFAVLHRLGSSGVDPYSDDLWKISLALHLLAYSNSCMNPFIYAFMSESFREGFMVALRGCYIRRKRGQQGRRRISQQSTYWSATNTRNLSLSSANCPHRIGVNV